MDEELQRTRIASLQQLMEVTGVMLQVVSSPASLYYLLGVRLLTLERLVVLLVPATGRGRLVIPEIHLPEVGWVEGLVEVCAWSDGENPVDRVADFVGGLEPGVAVWCDHGVPASVVLELVNGFPQLVFRVSDELVGSLREIKDEHEVRLLKEAGAIADRVMDAAVAACRPGATEMDVAAAIIHGLLREGAEPEPPLPIVASGPNAAVPHHRPGGRVLQPGDVVLIDFGGRWHGYCSDITRTVFLGTPTKEFLEVYGVVRAAQAEALSSVRPGVRIGELDAVARSRIAAAGYGEQFTHRLGHGIGLEVHEEPYVHSGSVRILREGMCFSIEPGVYLPGKFGVRIEDCVVVTGRGAVTLTHFPRDVCR